MATLKTAVLVLLPGLHGTDRLFQGLRQAFGAAYETLAISYPKDVPLGYEALEAQVREQLPTQPFVLFGESFSGPIAIRIAADPPTGLIGLILCATFAKNPYPRLAWAKRFASYLPLKSLPRWIRAP